MGMRKRKGGRKVMWMVAMVTSVIIGIIVFFNLPYSKIKVEFNELAMETMNSLNNNPNSLLDVFTEADLIDLPLPVRKYFEHSGFIGTPKMSYMRMMFKNVDFVMSPDKPPIKINYTQYNFVSEPTRMAFIDSTLFGIPFQGLDSYVNGVGRMKGVLAKTITLFNQSGEDMNKACLVTVLSESLIVPSVALQDYIAWDSIDDTHARATISYDDISASGIFTFSEEGEPLSFTTDDRAVVGTDGTLQQVRWTALFGDYKMMNGIKQPSHLQAVWNYDSGDLIYFDSDDFVVEYDI